MWLRSIRAWVTVTVLLSLACGDSGGVPDVGPQDPLWEPVIAQHSGGEISRRDPIRVVFTRDVADEAQIGSSASEAISVRPSIEGSVTFTSASEIMVVPEAELEPGSAFTVTVHASGLRRVNPELDRYQFVVRVMEQGLDVDVGGLSPDPDDGARLVLTGRVVTADVDEPERVERLVQAHFRGQDLGIRWNHDFSGRTHDFTVEGIARGDREETLTVSWDGAPLGVESSEVREITVPAIGVFAITRIVAVQGDRQYVLVEFSDPLDDGQNLTGLLSLGGAEFTSGVEDNQIRVYPAEVVSGDVSVVLQPGIRSAVGTRLEAMREASITFAQTKPGVRFAGTGNILPSMDPLTVPIEAVNVHSVQLTAFAIEGVKMGQFLQTNTLDGEGELGRVGRYLWRRTLPLASPIADQWNRYLLDVSDLMGGQEWGMVRLALSIHRGNSTYACSEEDLAVPVMREAPLADIEDYSYQAMRGWSGVESQYDPTVSVSFDDREDPCKDAYYRFSGQTTAGRNYIASNLGLLAKRDELGSTLVTTTNLATSEPEPGVDVTFMSFQDRPITTVTTGPDGMARLDLEATPFYALAEKGGDRGYLRMSAGGALSTSHFDVGGVAVTGGLKGFVYGERGVWRPGDTLHLTFVSQHDGEMPDRHPATMQVFNPRGQLVRSITSTTPTNGFYPFRFATDTEAPTGAWSAAVTVGGSRFTKALTIETVVPNRLRVDLDAGGASRLFGDEAVEFGLFGQWLSGAIARELRADVEVRLRPLTTRFEAFPGYGFDDPARSFSGEAQRIFDGELDESGRASFTATITPSGDPAGFVSAAFTSRVFERGGAFSTSRSSIPYSPYTRYVGVRVPEGSRRGMLVTDTTHMIDVATVDAEGAPMAVSDLRVTVYKMQWRWWWDRSGESMAQYATSEHRAVVDSGTVSTTADGRGAWPLRIDYPQWGRYLIRVCDSGGRHCTGQIFYIDWPGWAGRPQQESGVGASVLTLAADSEEYSVGQVARIELPEAEQGRALVTVENGSRILDARWVELTEGRNRFDVPITEAMAPTAYLSVTLIQPHAGRDNDRPLRLYGVLPLAVSDPATRLTPIVQVADEWRPDRQVPVRVSEASGRAMTYTLAVVDEGLLDLTNFQTPDLHAHFYQKERLGVRTWDVFDHVVGAYGGALERLLALGGGDAEDVEETEPSRYPPVVRYLGPFDLAPGATAEHQVDLPQYIGAVRVMVVAGRDGAYGRADESVFVREPLSLLATLPRVVGPEEEITLPVSLFAMTEDVRDATVRVETDELFEVVGSPSATVEFPAPGEEMAFLRLRVGSELGTGRILVTATSGEHNTRSEIFLTVRSPNPMTVRQQVAEIAPGERWTPRVVPHGLPGTNRSVLEVTTLPPLNLETRLRHLTRAPYGNIEHMVSSVFPQLYLPGLIRMDQERRDSVDARIRTVADRIRGYQLPDGSMSYWPGGTGSGGYDAQASWTTNYVGHFLIEAEKRGYYVAPTMKAAWVDHQRATAQAWRVGGEVPAMDHAYRLYTLALAGRADMGAMNRLRASNERGYVSSWYLAAAYGLTGLRDVGLEVARQAERQIPEYGRPGWSFGSRFRDLAIRLTALLALEMDAEAEEVAREISDALYSNRWLSSHTTAYALLAMAQMYDVDGSGGGFAFDFGRGGAAASEVASSTPVHTAELVGLDDAGEAIEVVNTTDRTLYASVMSEGMPATGDEVAAAEGLSIDVRYLTPQGTPVNERSLVQGTDLMVRVTVSNTSRTRLDNLALEHRMPSGWEILNARIADEGQAPFQHQDVRDDRIFTYFSLDAGRARTFTTLLNASYLGTYHLPTVSVEAMYDGTKYARTAGYRVEVTEPVR